MLLSGLPALLGEMPIMILLQTIVDQYLFSSYCLTIVSEKSIDFKPNTTYTYLKPELNGTVEELTAQLLVVSEKGCSDYIVNMRDPRKFMTAFDVVSKSGNVRRSDRKVIFLPNSAHDTNISLDVFSMKQTNYIANLLMVMPNREVQSVCEVYDMITHKFAGYSDGETKELVYIDQWDSCTGNFKFNLNLFLNDMNNLFGKIIKVACFTYKPYVLLDLDIKIAPNRRDGFEIRIIEEFCKWINCTIEIVREDKNQWGEIYQNGTGVGILGSVAEDRSDLGICGLYSWHKEFQYLDYSAATIRSAITCVAPSPRLLSTWGMPLMPFSWYIWYAVLITFILASIGLVIAKKCSSDGVLLLVFGVMISQSQSQSQSTWRVRIVMAWLLVAGMVLVTAYGGGLASTFTIPKYEPSIDTVQDLVDRNMEWGATHDAWVFSLTASQELIKQLVSQFRVYSAAELKRRSFTRSMALSIEKLPAGYFAIGDYITKEALEDLTLMVENFYHGECVVMLRKSSPYTEKMTELIGRLHQSGLLYAWETQVALTHLNYDVQQHVKLSRRRTDVFTKPLTSWDVGGVFLLYIGGVLLSLLMFIGEVFTTRVLHNWFRHK